MAVAVGSTSTLALGSARTTSTITAPASIANGDLLLAIIIGGDAGDLVAPTITGPAGFTKVTGSPFSYTDSVANFALGLNVFWKIAASESGSYAFTHSSASTQAIMYRLTGAHATAPISPTPTHAFYIGDVPQVGKTATAPSITTTANGSLVIYACGLNDGGPGTPPAGSTPTFTERLDAGAMYVADGVLATAGATGAKANATAFTAQSNTSQWTAMLIAVQPAGVAGAYSVVATGGSYSFAGSTVGLNYTALSSSPIFRAAANTSYTGRFNTTTVNKPTGTSDGDIMVASFFAGSPTAANAAVTGPPAGWTQIGTETLVSLGGFNGRLYVYWKRASSEGADYTFTHVNTPVLQTQAIIVSYSNCVPSGSPVDIVSQNSATTGATATATGVTTTVANTKLIYSGHNWDNSQTLTPPTGMTERLDGLIYYADENRAAAGATGNRTQTLASSNPWQAYLIALKPAGPAAYTVLAAGGSYAFIGATVGLNKTKRLVAAGGAYGFTGTTVTAGRGLIAAGGSYSFGGSPALMFKTSVGGVSTVVTGQLLTTAAGTATVTVSSPVYSWDNATLAGAGTLSSHDQILTVPASGTASSIKSKRLHDPGKHTVETQFMGGNPVGRWGLYNAASNTGTLVVLETGAVLQLPAGTLTPTFDPILDGDTLCCAYDGDTGEVWFRVNNGAWNNDLAQSPDSTGIGLWEPPTDVGYSGTLTTYAGPNPLKVEVDGTIIENLDIGYGYISVLANNVTIRNCKVFGTEYFGIVVNVGRTGALIDHCTVSSAGRAAAILVDGEDYVIRNCDLTGYDNGIFPGPNGLIENCYIHDLSMSPDAHVDGIQFAAGHDVEINNCWVEAFDTSDIIIKADGGPIDNILVEDCTLIGNPLTGQETAATVYATSMGTNLVTNIRLNRNRMQAGFNGDYVSTNNSIPEAFFNIDYFTSARILQAFAGYSFPILPALVADSGLVHVPPVEPRGSSVRLSSNYVGLSGDVFTATPVHRSHWLSPFGYAADAYVDKPAGVAENDILIVVLYRTKSNEAISEPVMFSPGWTQLGVTQTFHYGNYNAQYTVWWKRAGTVEPAQYLWGFFEETNTQSYIGAYSGVTLAGAIDEFSQNGGFGLTATGLSVGATQDTDLLVYLEAGWAGLGNLTPPAGMTEIVDAVLYVAEETRTMLGPTGNRSHAQDPADTAPPWLTTMITLRGA